MVIEGHSITAHNFWIKRISGHRAAMLSLLGVMLILAASSSHIVPAAYAARGTMTVLGSLSDGKPVSIWMEIQNMNGSVMKSGFTPLTFAGVVGKEYRIVVSDNSATNLLFDHWDNGSTSKIRYVTLGTTTSVTAYYEDTSLPNYTLAIYSEDMSGNSIIGYYTTISEGGKTVQSGYTPLTFVGSAGLEYVVTADDYSAGNTFFERWSDGVTAQSRMIVLDSDMVLTSLYTTTSKVTVEAYDQTGRELNMYTTIRDGTTTVLAGFTPLTYEDDTGKSISVTVSNYGSLTFDSWGNGSTSRSQTITLNGLTLLTANYVDSSIEDTPATSRAYAPHVYVPAYWGTWKTSLIDEWDRLIQSVKDNPDVGFVVTINPASGPGSSPNSVLASKAQALKDAGATVIGYVGVNYFSELPKSQYPVGNSWPSETPKTMSDLKGEIDRYRSFYPMIDGFMFDDYPNMKTISGLPDGSTKEVFSLAKELNDYARSKPGITFIKANPGTHSDADYFLLNDNLSTYEGSSVPSSSRLDYITYNGSYAEQTSIVVHSLDTLPSESTISGLYDKVKYIYITNNTYNSLPTYWDYLLSLLPST